MLEGQLKPLDVAKRVLQPDTISSVRQSPFHLRAWTILDRWALNSPQRLKALETQGEVILLGRLLDQQTAEHEALMDASEMLQTGVSESEVLALANISTELS
ncbi:hypothetical protein [Paraburkholderia sprentiae]|uniref:hypothetical protein n=1 Tax=Paraburkholderia sprentiae TaxID=948107 RepID=UPI000429031E|nr:MULTISPECIES: hypothetical protein [Paraburkholderia]